MGKASLEASNRAKAKYFKEKVRRVSMNLAKSTDADIIEKLESVDSMQGYIKALIRADIAAAKYYTAEADTLHVLEEFASFEDAAKAIAVYEAEDRQEGLYEPGSYAILDRDGRRIDTESDQE